MAGVPRTATHQIVTRLLLALALAAALVVVGTVARPEGTATAAPPQETYYTLMDAELLRTSLETSHDRTSQCCALPETMHVITSILSAVNGNVVYYDHYEDGYEADPFAPVQASTLVLNLDAGDVWVMDDDIPLPRVATDLHFDGRDRISSSDSIAVTQAGWSVDTGTVHALASQVFELEDYGTAFRVPIGEDANYNQMFDYVGLLVTAQADGTVVEIDNDGDGIADTTSPALAAGQVYLVNGGVHLGAAVTANAPVSVHVQSGNNRPSVGYEGRLMELYPTASWSTQYISPVSSIGSNGTRVFLFNPSAAAITVTPTTTSGTVAPITVPANGQASYLMPSGQGASFSGTGDFYAVQAITSESNTSSYDWGFTLVPFESLTTAVIVPLGYGMAKNGAGNIAENLSPVWVAAAAATTLYVDLDGDPATGALVDPSSNRYDFACSVTAYQAVTIYDDGTNACRAPNSAQPAGGDRDMTRARIYTVDGVEIAAAWGQRPGYDAINGLDFGTTVFPAPVPEIAVTKTAGVASIAEPGGTVTFTIEVTNVGSETVSFESLVDDVYGDLLDAANPQVSNNTCLTPTAPFNLIVDQSFTCSFDAFVAGTFGGPDHENTVVAGANGGTLTASGTATATITFTPRPATLSGSVADDLGNPIAGVTVTATDGVDTTSTTTDAAGAYSFTLAPGTYVITESQPAGYGDGGESAGTSGGTVADDTISNVVLASDDVVTGVDFDETTGSLSGSVFDDANGNGVLDAGEAITGVTVALAGTDVAGAVSSSTATAADGSYSFVGLLAGTYTLTETQPAGYADGADQVGTAGGSLAAPDSIASIVLPAGADATDYDFTEFVGASISGSVVDDATPAPAGIAGVTVTLHDTSGVVATTSTAADGSYSFSGLAPGSYRVVESQPAGYGDGTDSAGDSGGNATSVDDEVSGIALASGDAVTGVDFAETTASIAGFVYDDRDGDGVRDGGEPGIAGVTVTLSGSDVNGAITPLAATTAADGSYLFDGLLSGTYAVTETQPAGYLDGDDTAGSAGGTPAAPGDQIASIGLGAGEEATGYLFGEFVGATIAGSVTDDLGGPIAGATVTVYDAGGVVAVATTAADGSYSFPGLPPGTYSVVESQPAGYGDGGESAGTSSGSVSDDRVDGIVVASGDAVSGVDFVETTGSISGSVSDELGDPIAGVEVSLSGTSALGGPVSATTVTGVDGSFTFAGVPGGSYMVTETQPSAYGDGPDTAGDAGGVVDSAADTISSIVLGVDQDASGYAFVETLASIAGHVFVDADGDGVYTAGTDVSLAAAQVTLTGTDADGAIAPVTVVTDTDGSYLFDGLLAGTYTVAETQPAGYADGADSLGSAGGSLADDEASAIALAGGEDATDYDFGELPPGAISGSVRDELGVPLAGVTVTLTGTDRNANSVTSSTSTLADGSYAFSGLLPGTYTVTESQPAGFADVSTSAGSLGGDDSVENVVAGIVLGVDPLADTISTGNDFVEGYASLAGAVFVDVDGNGVRDAGEPGIADVEVTLSGSDVDGSITPVTVTTAADGSYSFDGLLAGTYTVTESQPAGYLDGDDTAGTAGGTPADDEVSAISLGAGVDASGYLFGEFVGASIAGSVVDDLGVPIAGVTVELHDGGASPVATTTTVADGSYSFTGLLPGSYSVVETQPAGYGDGGESAGTSSGTVSDDRIDAIELASGTAVTGVDFDETTGSIAGVVFEDVDGDGVRDPGEPGIPAATVTLSGSDPSGVITPVVATTAADGSYVFDGLLAGTYTVVETQPAGYLDGDDTAGTSGGSVVSATDTIGSIGLAAATDATGYLFGEYRAASIAASVRDDHGDPIAGVTVSLVDDLGGPVDAGTTGADGDIVFTGLAPGSYTLVETQPAGYGQGGQSATWPGANAGSTDRIAAIVVASGDDVTGNVFTETHASIAGSVYDDANGNDTLDVGEAIAGVTVTLTGSDPNGPIAPVVAVTTADGSYSFGDLLAGTYALAETQPTGYLDGTDTVGTAGGSLGADQVTSIALTAGVDATGYDFREYRGASIAGSVVDDLGAPIPGATVTLHDPSGVVAVTTTDAAGGYSFAGLAPGTYRVVESQPAGYGDGADSAGDSGGDATSVNDEVSGIVLSSGDVVSGVDFVETTGSISGAVFVDVDGDGVRDAGEPGIAGAAVTLSGTDVDGAIVPIVVATAADGSYSFDRLLAGTYVVTEAQPAGYLDGDDTAGTVGGTPDDPGDRIAAVALPAGVDATGYAFGELAAASVSGSVTDEHGAPIAGVVITLTGTDDRSGSIDVATTTAADGTYAFTGLRPGTYAVAEAQPAGYGDGSQSSADAGAVTTAANVISNLVLDPGAAGSANDFVETYSSLSGVVFHDLDGDGTRDPGEAGLAGVELTLTGTDPNGTITPRVVTTGTDGTYTVVDLLAGTYAVVEVQPAGYADGIDTAGTAGGSVVDPGDSISSIVLPAGVDATGYTFAEVGAPIGGTVWLDDDRDGSIDAAELRLPGVTVTLLDGDGVVVGTTTTDADGSYVFADLPAGGYTVVQAQPAGYGSTTPSSLDVTLTEAGVTDADFGEDLGSIGDTVWSDLDDDGTRDAAEPGLAGVTVRLLDEDGVVVATTVTDGTGTYRFDRLRAGRYTVEIVTPDGFVLTAPGRGPATDDSDPDPATGATGPIPIGVTGATGLVAGDPAVGLLDRRTDVDAGLVRAVIDLAISGSVPAATLQPGDSVTFTYDSRNQGNVPVGDGARVVVEFPVGLVPTSVDAPDWTVVVSGQTVTLVLDETLPAGTDLPTFTVTATVTAATPTLVVDAAIGTLDATSEVTMANNDSALAVTVTVPELPSTGSTPGRILRVGWGALLAGLFLAGLGRRRRLATV